MQEYINIEHQLKYGSVAQSVEQRTENPCVGGSIPFRATIHEIIQEILYTGGVAKWLNAADCKSAPIGFGSSNLPPSPTLYVGVYFNCPNRDLQHRHSAS